MEINIYHDVPLQRLVFYRLFMVGGMSREGDTSDVTGVGFPWLVTPPAFLLNHSASSAEYNSMFRFVNNSHG